MKKANKIRLNNVLYEVEDLAARNQIKELENNINGGENLGELKERVSSVENNLSQVNTNIDSINEDLSKANTDIDNVENSLSKANTDIDSIREDLSKVNTDIDNVENSLSQVNTDIDGIKEDLTQINTDIDGIESSLSKANTDIDNIESNLSKANTDIDGIENSLSQVNTDISNVENSLSQVNTDISNVENSLTQVNTDIDNIESNLSQVNTDIDGIKEDLTQINTDIDGIESSLSDPKRKYYETVILNDEGTIYDEETGSQDVYTLEPNKFYIWQEPIPDTLCINFAEEIPGVANEYLLQFSTTTASNDSGEILLTTPDQDSEAYYKLKFQDGTYGRFVCDLYTTYQVSIVNGLATVISFSSTAPFYIEIYKGDSYEGSLEGKYVDNMTWGEWIENSDLSELTSIEDNYTFNSFGAFAVNDSGIIVSYLIVDNTVELLDSSGNPVLATSKISDSPYYKVIGPAAEVE